MYTIIYMYICIQIYSWIYPYYKHVYIYTYIFMYVGVQHFFLYDTYVPIASGISRNSSIGAGFDKNQTRSRYIYECMFLYILKLIYTYIYTCKYIYTYVYTLCTESVETVLGLIWIKLVAGEYMNVCIHIHVNIYIYIHVNTYTYVYTQTYIHIYLYMCSY
jgi:hypothetical protein